MLPPSLTLSSARFPAASQQMKNNKNTPETSFNLSNIHHTDFLGGGESPGRKRVAKISDPVGLCLDEARQLVYVSEGHSNTLWSINMISGEKKVVAGGERQTI
jgi:hypothetical protein